MNSIYCNCKVVDHAKIAKEFFPKETLIRFTLYLYFICPLHTIIKRNDGYNQNYTTKCKKCFAILKKTIFACGRVKTLLRSANLLRSEFQMIIEY